MRGGNPAIAAVFRRQALHAGKTPERQRAQAALQRLTVQEAGVIVAVIARGLRRVLFTGFRRVGVGNDTGTCVDSCADIQRIGITVVKI